MSNEASTWAISQRPANMADKMVLLAYGNCASPHGRAYASIAYICEYGSMDPKTVNAAIKRLVAAGYLIPTNEKAGSTGQIPVYQMPLDREPENKIKNGANPPKNGKVSENGKLSGFSAKAPQKRNTETVLETQSQKDKPSEPAARRVPTRLKGDWQPSEADFEYAKGRGFGRAQIGDMAADFRTHFTEGRGRNTTHLNWAAAWQQWVRRERVRPGTEAADEPVAPGVVAAKPGESPEATKFRRAIAEAVGDRAYQSWIAPMSLRVDGDRVALVAHSSVAADYVRNNLGAHIQRVGRKLFAGSREVIILASTPGRRAA